MSPRTEPSDRALLPTLAGMLADPDRGVARLAALPDERAGALIALARAHGVEAWLAAVAPGRPAWGELAVQGVRFRAAAARDRQELARFGELADGLALPWCAVKGQAVAEAVYPRPYWRYGVDIDVLVPPDRFAELCERLPAAGWQLLDRNWPLLAATVPGELRFRSPTGALFDVHWHLMTNPALRAAFVLPTGALLARRRTLPAGLPALDPADQLVHLAVHAALSGASRLGWLADCGLAASRLADPAGLAERAREARAGHAVALVLDRAHRWLGTPVLPGRPAWRGLTALVDRASPLAGEPDRPALARSFARSVRGSAGASTAEFLRHALAFARSGAPRERAASPLTDPADPRSPLHDRPDEGARRQYLSALA
ncbi:MAG TPA: nucleotidyltransferase family protein [Jatrophihabitans sp.]|nr:nucleotidyltransferase family protein [Jatrophihabitans sp.]